jgi:hypothetical protein
MGAWGKRLLGALIVAAGISVTNEVRLLVRPSIDSPSAAAEWHLTAPRVPGGVLRTAADAADSI